MTLIVRNNWTLNILRSMNTIKPFDLSRVNFKAPLTPQTDESMIERRNSFYKYQMDILKKLAVPMDTPEDPLEHTPYRFDRYDDADVMTWSASEDMDHEFFPHQIVLAIRLTRPTFQKKYKYIPEFESFFYTNDRLCIRLYSEKYTLRYMLAQRATMENRGHRLIQ